MSSWILYDITKKVPLSIGETKTACKYHKNCSLYQGHLSFGNNSLVTNWCMVRSINPIISKLCYFGNIREVVRTSMCLLLTLLLSDYKCIKHCILVPHCTRMSRIHSVYFIISLSDWTLLRKPLKEWQIDSGFALVLWKCFILVRLIINFSDFFVNAAHYQHQNFVSKHVQVSCVYDIWVRPIMPDELWIKS